MVDGLSQDVQSALLELIDSIESLELLVFFHRGEGRSWTLAEIADQLGAPEPLLRSKLERLEAEGLVGRAGEHYQYGPTSERLARAADLIAGSFATRRIATINFVASSALERIREIAEAFRLGKRKQDT